MASTRRNLLILSSAPALAALAASRAMGQEQWPQRPIRIVVPYAPGASTDAVTRRLAQELSARLGWRVFVENRSGAMGTIGTAEVLRQRPDGYTLAAGDSSYVISPHLLRNMPYDQDRDLVPIAGYVFSPLGVIVKSSSPFATLQDLLDRARAQPRTITFGSGGAGSSPHLATEALAIATGTQFAHIPFRGAGEAILAVLSGTIDMQFVSPATAMGNLQGGTVRMLAISGDRRLKILPDVPTFAEAGVPGYNMSNWIGLWAPTGTPEPVIDILRREVGTIMNAPDLQAYAESIGADPRVLVGAEFGRFLQEERKRWGDVVESIGLERQ